MIQRYSTLALTALLLAACNKDTPTSSDPVTSEFVHAKAGSIFTFDEHSTDSTNAMIPGSRDTMIATVLQTNGAIGGRTGVLVVDEQRASGQDTAYSIYEADNNFSVYVNPTDPSFLFWERVPTGTGITTVRRSEYSFGGLDTTEVRDSTISSLVGAENITIKGQPVSTKMMQLRFRHVVTTGGIPGLNFQLDNILYYAPSLGFVAKTSSPAYVDPFGKGWINGRVQTMIDYNLI